MAFGVATAYWPGIPSAAFMPRWWAIAIGLPLISNLDPRNLPRPIGWCMVAGLAWAAVTLLWTPVPQTAALDLFFLVLLCGTMIASAGIEDIEPVLVAFCWGIAISSLLCIPQALGWSPVPQHGIPAGLFLNAEVMAEIAAPLLVWTIWKRRWMLTSLMAIPVLLCHSRVSVFVVAAGMLVGAERRWLRVALGAALVAAGVMAVFVLGPAKMQSALERVTLWISAFYSITPFGHGLGWWNDTHAQAYDQFVHSDVLQLVVEIGAGSLFFFAIPVLVLWRQSGSIAERAAFVGLCLEAAISFPLHLPAQGFLFFLLAGSLVGARTCVRNAESTGRIGARAFVRGQTHAYADAFGSRKSAFAVSVQPRA